MKKLALFIALLFITSIIQAQVKISIGKYSQTVTGSLTIDYVVRTVGKTDYATCYFDIDNDSICFSQLRKRENENKYYLYYRQKAAIVDLDLSSKNIWENAYLERGKIFYYVDLVTKDNKFIYTFFINDSGVTETKEESTLAIYCYTKVLGETIYDNIKVKQDSKK